MRRWHVKWGIVAGFLSAGLLLRVLFFCLRPPLSGDALVYGDIASNLLHHGTYAITVEGVIKPTLIRLPGYPFFLGMCFAIFGTPNFVATVWLQISLSLAECCLLGMLATRLAGARAGYVALALSALCPFTANYSVVPLTEALSTFCITLSFWLFEQWSSRSEDGSSINGWLLALGSVMSFAALLRPDRALLSVVLVPAIAWVAWGRSTRSVRRLKPPITVCALVLLPLTFWSARNWREFHVFQPLSPKYANDPGDEVALGFMRWYRTWGISYKNTVEVYWEYDGSLVDPKALPDRAFDGPAERKETLQLLDRYNDESGSTQPIDTAFASLARRRISAHPLRYYLLLPLARLANMWFQPRTELLRMPLDWWNWSAHRVTSAISVAYVLLNAAYIGLAAWGFVRWRRIAFSGLPELAYAMGMFVLLRSLLLATLDNAEQRYTVDCFPVLLLLASFALAGGKLSVDCDEPSC